MLTQMTHSQVYVLDQDEALDFYVGKLGLEVQTDQDLGFMRWLTVAVPGHPDRAILLERPGPPFVDEESRKQLDTLVAKGMAGGSLFFEVDDCRAKYEELVAKGVEFVDPPTERFYGIDAGFRDDSGNHIRMTQRVATGIEPPAPSKTGAQYP